MISSISITNFRGFKQTKLSFKELSVIVGKNNAGKSTLIEALRIASIISNKLIKPTFVNAPNWLKNISDKGIKPSIKILSISSNNIFYLYNEPPAIIQITFTNKIKLTIYIGNDLDIFAQIEDQNGNFVTNNKMAKSITIPKINILPQITPLLEEEEYLKDKTIKSNQFSRLTSRHFRNQIYRAPAALINYVI